MMSSFIVLSSHSLTEKLFLSKYQIVHVRAALWFLKGRVGKCTISVMVTQTRRNSLMCKHYVTLILTFGSVSRSELTASSILPSVFC